MSETKIRNQVSEKSETSAFLDNFFYWKKSSTLLTSTCLSNFCRAKSLNKDNSKGGNVCSECKKTTDRLSYCFHCASAVCEDCRSQHTEGVVKDLEKQNNTLQGKPPIELY